MSPTSFIHLVGINKIDFTFFRFSSRKNFSVISLQRDYVQYLFLLNYTVVNNVLYYIRILFVYFEISFFFHLFFFF